MNQHNFDKLVRDKLAALTAEQEANSWEMFTQKWTATEATSAAAVDAFDRAIQDKIGGLSALSVTDAWNVFEQRLEENTAGTPTVDIAELDNTIYNKLYNYQVPYEAATWNILLAKLRRRAWQRIEIGVYKVAELAILSLLLLFGQQFFTYPTLQSFPVSTTTRAVAGTELNIIDTDSKEHIVHVNELANSSISVEKKIATADRPKSAETNTTLSISKQSTVSTQTTQSNLTATDVAEASANFINQNAQVAVLSPLTVALQPLVFNRTRPLVQTEELTALPNSLSPIEFTETNELAQVALILPEKKRTIRFGMFGAGTIDRVFTPKDRLFPIDAYDRYSPGYSGGFSIGKPFLNDRWEVEAGLMYISKRYSQQVVVNFFGGSVRNGYEVDPTPSYVEMNMINLPISLRYNVINTNKWKVYSIGGASLQLILQANYDREDWNNILRFGAAPAEGIDQSPNSTNKRFNNGFLADSDFENNRYYSYNIGIGLERFVSPRWSLFAQPTYQHTIKAFNSNGIGPNRDRINTMLIMLGAKVGL